MIRAALLIVVLALLAPTTAGAYTTAQLNQWAATADSVWPNSACAGRLHPVVVGSLPAEPGSNLVTLGQANLNDAITCRYWLVADLPAYEACVVTVHEVGHLAGFDHAPGGIMDPEPTELLHDGSYKPCAQAAPPTLSMSAAANWVQARWDMGTLDCRRDRIPSRQRCHGTSYGGRHLTFVVWRTGSYAVRGGRLK